MGSSSACKSFFVFNKQITGSDIVASHPIMKRLADFEDSPLVPALLATIHTESDKKLMDVSRNFISMLKQSDVD